MVGWWDGGMGGMAGMVVWWYGGMAGMGVVQLPGKRNISCNCSTATPGLPATPGAAMLGLACTLYSFVVDCGGWMV